MRGAPALDRLLERVTYDHGCWTWTGSSDDGYAIVHDGGRKVRGHRVTYEAHS